MHATKEDVKPEQYLLVESTGVKPQKLVKHSTIVLLDDSDAVRSEEAVESAMEKVDESKELQAHQVVKDTTVSYSSQYKSKMTSMVYLDESDEIQIEEDESFELRTRGAGGWGCCAEQTDMQFSLICGLISCD